jgi:hypothetical protein
VVGRWQGSGHGLVGGATEDVRVRAPEDLEFLLSARRVDGQAEAVCTEDRAISVDRLEEMAARAGGDVVRWACSHSPFLSRPANVAEVLSRLAAST